MASRMCNKRKEVVRKDGIIKTHNICDFRCSVKSCWKVVFVDVRIDGCMEFCCLGKVLTNPEFVGHSWFLRLDRDNKRRGLKGTT